MKIEKISTNRYRVRKTISGKTTSIFFDHYPSEKEILVELAEKIDIVSSDNTVTFEVSALEYCAMKKNVLSPRTHKEYINTIGRLSHNFKNLRLYQINQTDIQLEINRLASKCAPKTVRNYHGFISSVLGHFRPDMKIYTTLPQKVKKEPYIPTDEDIKRLLEYSKTASDGRYYLALNLACYGLRRSELICITDKDIKDDIVTVDKAKVLNSDGEWVIKTTKTTSSTRKVPISHELAQKIIKQGYVYCGHPNNISDFIGRALKKLDIPHFSLHKLRHYFVSKLCSDGVDTATVLKLGGYSSDYVMKSVYRHAIDNKELQAVQSIMELTK